MPKGLDIPGGRSIYTRGCATGKHLRAWRGWPSAGRQ